MAKLILKGVPIYIGGYAMGGQANSLSLDSAIEEVESTTLIQTFRDYEAGLHNLTGNVAGFVDPTTDGEIFADVRGQEVPIAALFEGGTIAAGDPAWFARVECGSYQGGGQVGALWGFTIPVQSGGTPLVRGYALEIGTSRSATGNGNGVQVGATSASQRLAWYLGVTEFTGTSLGVDLVSDGDNTFASATTRASLTTITDGGGVADAQFGIIEGPITDDWFRFEFTFTGTSFAVVAFVGVY